MIKKYLFNAVLLMISVGFSITGNAQAVNKKVRDFLGEQQIQVYSKTEQGRSTLKFLTYISDSSFYIIQGDLAGKAYPDFSQVTPIMSKYTGISGTTQWTSINDFNPLLYDFTSSKILTYSLGNGSYLVIRDNNEISRLYGFTAK